MYRSVTVFGSSRPVPGSIAWEQARRAGGVIGRHGLRLVNGGYGGTMAASALGARETGGQVTGITVAAYVKSLPNPHLTEEIRCTSLFERLERLVKAGDLYLVLPGGTGTLVELCLVWELLNKGVSCKPVLVDAAWQGIRECVPELEVRGEWFREAKAEAPATGQLVFCSDPVAALEWYLDRGKWPGLRLDGAGNRG